MTPIPRYAVVVQEEEPFPFHIPGEEPPKRHKGTLICSIDGGKTWTIARMTAPDDTARVADLLNKHAEDQAVADLARGLEGGE